LNERDISEALLRELSELGYPESSVRSEFPVSIGRHLRTYIDVAVIDPDTSDVLAIIEIKGSTRPEMLKSAAKQVAAQSKMLPSAPMAFVYAYDGEEKIIGRVSEEDSSLEDISSLPQFKSLRSGGRAHQKIESKKKSNRVTDTFTICCYVLAILVAVILALDVASIYKFSSQQLSLLGIFIGLIVIPYAAKFKLLGMEFERYFSQPNQDS
jgi:hypothetical protein